MESQERNKIFIFPFKYKISIAINIIIIVLLGAIFHILQSHIENYAIENIGQNLKTTKAMVSALIQERHVRLSEISRGLGGSELVRVILTDPSLDQLTANDIVENEILPNYPQLSILCIANTDGKILSVNSSAGNIADSLHKYDFFKDSLHGNPGAKVIPYMESLVQILAIPITVGDDDENAIFIGVLLTGITFSSSDLEKIKTICGTDIFFPINGKSQIATSMMHIDGTAINAEEMKDFISSLPAEPPTEPVMTFISEERFIYLPIIDRQGGLPLYIIAKSLDKELSFVKKIKAVMINFGLAGLIAGMIAGFIFAFGISRPIRSLQIAANEIDKGNLSYEVSIKSRDEFAWLGESFNNMIKGLNEKERIRGIMNRVVSREIAEEILKGELQLGGELKTASVLFTDIRGFTSISESMNPKSLLDLLNLYFTKISFCIDTHKGNIDKYIGDAVMALFGLPVENKNHALNAVLSALDIAETVEIFNETLKSKGIRPISIGTGISTGTVVAGLMGASTRMEYTVLGDDVNLASRLEGLTKHFGADIIASVATIKSIEEFRKDDSEKVWFRQLDIVRVKGKTEGVSVYQIFKRNEIRADMHSLISMSEEAGRLLRNGSILESQSVFKNIVSEFPDDPVASKFLDRIDGYLKNQDYYRQSYAGNVFISTMK